MKKIPVFPILLAPLIYAALFVLASSCGLIHPACYACARINICLVTATDDL